MSFAVSLQLLRDFFRKGPNILSIRKNWDPLAMVVRLNTFQSLQHFIPEIAKPPWFTNFSESSVLHTECVCKTHPTFRAPATARCKNVSADGLPFASPAAPVRPISRKSPSVSADLSKPEEVISNRSGSTLSTAL